MLPKKPKTNILVDGGDPSFKTRMAIDAQSAPHTLFDYYSPDASVTIAPDRFIVVEARQHAKD